MEGDISMNRENAWTTYEEADIKALEGLCKEYKDFLSNGKTERECVAQSIELAKKAGYQDLEELIKNQTPLKAVTKYTAHGWKKRSHYSRSEKMRLKMD